MNLSLKWLNDYIKIDMPIREFVDGMTMSGSKVEKYRNMSEPLEKVVVGLVKNIEKHCDSDKLWIVEVDIGKDSNLQIVTGAQNVFKGAFVPVVLDGGRVIDRKNKSVVKIKKGKLRGVESQGMLCSFTELGLEHSDFPYSSEDGILIFNDDPIFDKIKVGLDVTEFIGLNDISIEFEITNNRPDCLAVLGLAREAGATFDLPFNKPIPKFKGVPGKPHLAVEVKNPALCPRYMAAVVKNVKIEPSPRWMVERLRTSGIRSINNFVDITNFVMLEYGHPMHAFDKKYVSGDKIIIRDAENGEEITLLDGTVQKLTPDILVIADSEKPIAVAGVMGGEHSGIMADTDTVVFEAAGFDGVSVRRAAKKVGRRTDSSARFEKGIDSINAKDALYRALELVEMLGCGEVVSDIIDIDNIKKQDSRLKHDYNKINEILGTNISETEQVNILKKLGFIYNESEKTFTPPHVRIDLELGCDLAEEIARIYGYNKIKSTIPKLGTIGKISDLERFEKQIHSLMTGMGYNECVTFSFISPKSYIKCKVSDALARSLEIRNPLGEDTSVMRTTLIPSIMEVIERNSKNHHSGRFYEIGRIYQPKENSLPDELKTLIIGLFGSGDDFFTLKGIVEELIYKLGISDENIKFKAHSDNKTFHPGRTAEIFIGDLKIGIIGEINPLVVENYDINHKVYTAELSVGNLFESFNKQDQKKYKTLPKFPSLTRDLSLVCDEALTSDEIIDIIRGSSKHLEKITFFDIYMGEQIPKGKKSLSYKLILRKDDGTLTDGEADEIMCKILSSLKKSDIVLR